MKKWIKRGFFALLLGVLLVLGLNYQPDRSVEALKVKYANAASKFIEIDGMSVHYRDEGNPLDTLPIVLIHGTGANLLTWDGWVADLRKDHRVIRLDLPAYGLTGPNPKREYTPPYYVQFLHDFLEKLAVKRCYVAGNSLGGRIAWGYAAAYPTVVEKLILVDAAGYKTKSKGIPLAFRLATVPVEKSLKDVYADDSKVTPALVEQYLDMACRAGNRQAFIDRISVLHTDESAAIRQIKTPTLIIWGGQDDLIPLEIAYLFQKDLANDSLLIFNHLGHVPQEESPVETVAAARAFLKK
jgi:pimeloyl-ACP methyl ester carboxylesterase